MKTVALALIAALTLTACGGEEPQHQQTPDQPQTVDITDPGADVPAPTPEPEPKHVIATRVCTAIVTIDGTSYALERTVTTYNTTFSAFDLPETTTVLEVRGDVGSKSITMENSGIVGPVVLDETEFFTAGDTAWARRHGVWVVAGAPLACEEGN